MIESTILGAVGVAKLLGISGLGGATGYSVYSYVRSGRGKTVNDVFAACGLCNYNKQHEPIPWKILKVSKGIASTRYVMKFPFGKTLSDVVKKADAINTGLGVDCAFGRDGSLFILDVPTHPLPSYVSYSEKVLELTRGSWKTVIGVGLHDWILHDFDERPHLLIAGLTRGGKSVLLAAIIATLHLSHPGDEIEFVGVDMKPQSLEFRKFAGIWTQLVSTPQKFLSALISAEADMEERAKELAIVGVSNVKQYERVTGKKFSRRFIIVDEYGKSYGSDEEDLIKNKMMQICAMGAGLGVHVILCTQRPDADVIDGKIRANVGTVTSFKVTTEVQSRVALGHSGAEDLPNIPGRAIYQGDDEVPVQVPFISDAKLARLLSKTVPPKPDNSGNMDLKSFQGRSIRLVDKNG